MDAFGPTAPEFLICKILSTHINHFDMIQSLYFCLHILLERLQLMRATVYSSLPMILLVRLVFQTPNKGSRNPNANHASCETDLLCYLWIRGVVWHGVQQVLNWTRGRSSAPHMLQKLQTTKESRYPSLSALNSWLFDSSSPKSLTSMQARHHGTSFQSVLSDGTTGSSSSAGLPGSLSPKLCLWRYCGLCRS